MSNIRVLHIAEAFDPGGVAWWLIDVAKLLSKQGLHFDFLCLGQNAGMRGNEVTELGSSITLFQPSLKEVFLGESIRRLVQVGAYDIVHSHVFNLSGWLLRHAAIAGLPIRIAHFHNTEDGRVDSMATRIRRKISRYMITRYANVILACSEPALENAPRTNVCLTRTVVPYGIDLQAFRPKATIWDIRAHLTLPSNARLVGHVGRFYEQKNHVGLLRIFQKVVKQQPQTHLILVGDGPLQPAICELAEALGVLDHVWFLGPRPDVADLMPQFDVFAFPSLYEGVGIAVLEARMSSVPAVATDLPALRQTLADCTGFSLQKNDDEEAFSREIIKYLVEAEPIAAPEHWKARFSRDRSANDLLSVYLHLLERRRTEVAS